MNESCSSNFPEISVVVPVYNEASSISSLIVSLLNQTSRPNEIVITDAGSTDNTADIIEAFVCAGAPVKLIREGFSLPGRARNIAVANARNDWIAFIDAGILPERTWLAKLVARAQQESQIDVVYGTYEPVINSFFEECAAIAYVPPPTRIAGGMSRPHSIASALMRRSVWKCVGGFPEHLRSAEDLIFIRKVEQAGFRITGAPDAIVHWNLQPNLRCTLRRFVAYARNNIRAGLWREWQRAIFLRYGLLLLLLIPMAFFGWWWLVIPFGLWLGLMNARAVKSIYRNRIAYPAAIARNLARLAKLLPILTVIDVAAIVGSLDWLLRDKLRLGKTNP